MLNSQKPKREEEKEEIKKRKQGVENKEDRIANVGEVNSSDVTLVTRFLRIFVVGSVNFKRQLCNALVLAHALPEGVEYYAAAPFYSGSILQVPTRERYEKVVRDPRVNRLFAPGVALKAREPLRESKETTLGYRVARRGLTRLRVDLAVSRNATPMAARDLYSACDETSLRE